MRTSGVLMPISSLPSQYGIGTMGKEARRFVDFLEKGGQTYWQILPICPTSYEILHTSHFQALQAILILSIWSFYAGQASDKEGVRVI